MTELCFKLVLDMATNYIVLSGVVLTPTVKTKIGTIADAYNKLTNKKITITSGTRTAASQAFSMYGKLVAGSKLTVYRDQTSAQAIRKIYDDGVIAAKSKSVIVSEIKAEIDSQISNGKYISKHLKKGAVDVRSRNMTLTDKAHFKTAAKGVATIIILETRPPHFHLQF